MNRRFVSRASFAGALVAVSALLWAAVPVGAAINPLEDGIAPGVVRGTVGFGTSTVVVPRNGYVTYFVRGAGNLAGTPVQVWTTTGSGWTLATTRTFAQDGTLHYFARISGRTGFQARIPGTPGGAAHGRSGSTWTSATDTRTQVRVTCDDFAASGDGSSSFVMRAAGVRAGTTLDVILCSNASTGFSWTAAAVDTGHLSVTGHHYTAAGSAGGPPVTGAAGTETWSFTVSGQGAGYAVLAYSQPWKGGQKAAWTLVIETRS